MAATTAQRGFRLQVLMVLAVLVVPWSSLAGTKIVAEALQTNRAIGGGALAIRGSLAAQLAEEGLVGTGVHFLDTTAGGTLVVGRSGSSQPMTGGRLVLPGNLAGTSPGIITAPAGLVVPQSGLIALPDGRSTCGAAARADAMVLAAVRQRMARAPDELADLTPDQFLAELRAMDPTFPVAEIRDLSMQSFMRAREIARKCGTDGKCIVAMTRAEANRVTKEPWFKAWRRASCMGRHPQAFPNLVWGQVTLITTMGAAYATDRLITSAEGNEQAEFLWSPLSTWFIMNFVWAEIACINTYENTKRGAAGAQEKLKGLRGVWHKYKRMLPWIPVQAGLMASTATVEDHIRGKEEMSMGSFWNHLREDGAYAIVWGFTGAALKGSLFMHTWRTESIPAIRAATHKRVLERMLAAGHTLARAEVTAQAKARLVEGALHTMLTYGDNFAYTWIRRHAEPRVNYSVDWWLGPRQIAVPEPPPADLPP
jgi:hypothetical protein